MNLLPETNRGVVTSWIPITTAHPEQSGCSDYLWKFVPNTIAGWDPGYGISVNTKATCLPKPVTTWWLQDLLGRNEQTVLSIGPITCPEAYYTATTSAQDATRTYVACCPTNYDFMGFMENGDTGECVSTIEAGETVTYAERDDSGSWQTTSSSLSSRQTVAGIQVNGWIIAAETGSSTASPNDCAASAADALATAPGGAENATCRAGAQLSPGAVAGIGIGAAFGVLGLAALGAGLFMIFRGRKKSRPTAAQSLEQFGQTDKGAGSPPPSTSVPAFSTYHPDTRDTTSLVERQTHTPYERDVWSTSSTTAPQQQPPQHTYTYARNVPHGEMDGTTLRDTNGMVNRGPELEGEYDRNVKVSLLSPWLSKAQPVHRPPPSLPASSQYRYG